MSGAAVCVRERRRPRDTSGVAQQRDGEMVTGPGAAAVAKLGFCYVVGMPVSCLPFLEACFKGPGGQNTSLFYSKGLMIYSTLSACLAASNALPSEKSNHWSQNFASSTASFRGVHNGVT